MDPIRFAKLPTAAPAMKALAAQPALPAAAAQARGVGQTDLIRLPAPTAEFLATGGGPEVESAKVAQAASDFEAIFLSYLSSSMTRGALGGAEMPGAEFYQGMIDEQLGKLLAEAGGGLGLHDALSAAMSNPEETDHDAR